MQNPINKLRWVTALKGGISLDPADWFLVLVCFLFIILMMIYVFGTFNPSWAFWK